LTALAVQPVLTALAVQPVLTALAVQPAPTTLAVLAVLVGPGCAAAAAGGWTGCGAVRIGRFPAGIQQAWRMGSGSVAGAGRGGHGDGVVDDGELGVGHRLDTPDRDRPQHVGGGLAVDAQAGQDKPAVP